MSENCNCETCKDEKCPCQSWTGRADWIDGHHPNCDSKGNHIPLPPESAKYEQVAGMMVEKATDKIPGVTTFAKPEPSLSLLVIDLGDNVIIKTERGEIDIKLGGVTYQCRTSGLQDTSLYSFADVRAVINGEKPVPRIERDATCFTRHFHIYFDPNDENACFPLSGDLYDALSTLAGKPLPIYNGGVWEEVGHIDDDVYNNIDLRVWRYSR